MESLPLGGKWVEGKEAKKCGDTGMWNKPDGGGIENRVQACQ